MLQRWFWSLLSLLGATVSLVGAEKVGHQARPFDWPQWQGPQRTALSQEKGLLASWPQEGPELVWKARGLGGGFSTPSIAAGRIFGVSYRGDDEVVWALEESTGQEIWKTRIAKAKRPLDHGEGSRSTPTVDGDVLFALGVSGDLVCLETATGKERWHVLLTAKEFGGSVPGWGYSESPLVDGAKLIATPGGKMATLLALDKKTGNLIWKGQVPQGDGAHYSSVIAAEVDGHRQYIQFLRGGVVGVAADDGKFLWRYDHPHNGTANCSTPLFLDNCVFAASDYGTGGGLAKLSRNGDGFQADEVYFTKKMKNHHGGMVLVNGYLYGSDGGQLCCLEFKTGKVQWEEGKAGKGSITYADGHLYYRNEGGTLILIEANPSKYIEKSRFKQPDRSHAPAWAHPVIANGRLYIADQDILLCYDVKQK